MSSLELSLEHLQRFPESTLVRLLESASPEQLLSTWASNAGTLPQIREEWIDAFLRLCEQTESFPALQEAGFLSIPGPWSQNPPSQWLLARALTAASDPSQALSFYRGLIPQPLSPRLLLDAAQCAIKAIQWDDAWQWLSTATRESRDYSLLQKAARLYRRIEKADTLPELIPLKVAFLFSSAPQLILPILTAKGYASGIQLKLLTPPFDNVTPFIRDPDSPLYEFRPDVVILGLNYRQLEPLSENESAETWIDRQAQSIRDRWTAITANHSCRILQQTCDLPHHPSDGNLSTTLRSGLSARIHQLNAEILNSPPPFVNFLDSGRLQSGLGETIWNDDRLWHIARQHPATPAVPALADEITALLRAQAGQTRKVLVLDLDNTLWGGVIGEDGIEGIQVGPETPTGEAFTAFQEYLLELKARGILLAVCSKNNETEARIPFETHDGMRLRLNDFVAFVANWDPKDQNLRAIAKQINLGLDSLVFVDDSPVECDWIRSRHPEVAVVQLPDDPTRYVETLDRGRWFESLHVSAEDRNRHALYRSQKLRNQAKEEAPSLESYLASLQMQVRSGPFDSLHLQRIAQLIQRTNQFNLTSRRHSPEQLERLVNDPHIWTQWFALEDRFGDNGLVGLVIAECGETTWTLDSFLMSCRVIGRKLEAQMLETVTEAARQSGATHLQGIYRPTPKNDLVSNFYRQHGFEAIGEKDGVFLFQRTVGGD
ncbi:HAD-IIIC family phosphatase [Puniceicoccus vermicola]|uniref:HAD-IIIC family phosphatase n=1 Tax=Puniceicoccus vermicola TaxID=388746 RepID=A0A7X1AWC5_9BACT|nr:HAD-IIIC family phosphatase [Puniceicoccus vermicola]MBC2601211.1 HAD-IIIC family phosphatase [Puniceicoccus vermicola]